MTKNIFAPLLVLAALCLPLCGCSNEEEQQTSPPPAAPGSQPPTTEQSGAKQPGAQDTPESDPIEDEDVREIK